MKLQAIFGTSWRGPCLEGFKNVWPGMEPVPSTKYALLCFINFSLLKRFFSNHVEINEFVMMKCLNVNEMLICQ